MSRIILTLLLVSLLCALAAVSREERMQQRIEEERQRIEKLESMIDQLAPLAETKAMLLGYVRQNNVDAQYRLFDEKSADMIARLDEGDASGAFDELTKLQVVFRPAEKLRGDLLYLEARAELLRDDPAQAQNLLERVVNRHGDSRVIGSVAKMLSTLYYSRDMNLELVSLYEAYPGITDPEFLFNTANAYYRIDRYDQANDLFNRLVSDPDYGFRSKAMLINISAYTEGLDPAIVRFNELEQQTPAGTEYRFFIYYQLALLHQLQNNPDEALANLEKYQAEPGAPMTDEIRVLMIQLYLKKDNKPAALALVNQIVENPSSYEYFTAANYILGTIYEDSGNLEKAEENIDQAIEQATQVIDILNTKKLLLKRHGELARQLQSTTDLAEKRRIIDEIKVLNHALENTTSALEFTSIGLGGVQINTMSGIETKHIRYDNQINGLRVVIDSLNTNENEEVEALLKREIQNLNEDTIIINAMMYVANLPEITEADYVFAYNLATEIYMSNRTLSILNELLPIAERRNLTNVKTMVNDMKEGIREDINLLEMIALYKFGEINEQSPQVQVFLAEAESNMQLEQTMRMLSEDIGERYNKAIAKKKEKTLRRLVRDHESIKGDYTDVIASMEKNMETVTQQYTFTKLNLMLKKSMDLTQ